MRGGYLILLVAVILLIHCTVLMTQHRKYLKLLEKPFDSVPFEILVECVVVLFLAVWGAVSISVDLFPIKATVSYAQRSLESYTNRQSFWIFDHRGQTKLQHNK
eukprot:TRINITY_DN6924_c0_g1_i1.p1 TRINITY_DN6924_c0_g1~~TRINITY_DN6924_c0_g1_i1.p1  ORF type:complete len:104 (+),score=14.45 TRINITY_DN6924_c0_g1_i1:50-361(+)